MPLRVMSYNVRYFGHALPLRGASATRRNLRAISRAVVTLGDLPHLICMQEVETRSLRSYLSHTPGHAEETQTQALVRSLHSALDEHQRSHQYVAYHFPAHAYSIGSARIYTTGLAILVRDDVEVLGHNADSPHDITFRRQNAQVAALKQSRICAHLRVADRSGKVVDLFNTHLSLPSFMSREFFRSGHKMGYGINQSAEVDRLSEFIRRNRLSDRYLVLGDFNSLPHSPVYERLIEGLDALDPFPGVVGASEHELHERWPTAGFLHMRMRLDHMFAGPGLECVDFEDTHPFGEEGRWTGLSDHVPLVARFLVRS